MPPLCGGGIGWGGCGHFLGQNAPGAVLGCQPEAPAVLVRAHPAERLLEAVLVIVAQIRLEPLDELLRRDPRPVPVVEELVLEPSEEPLAGRVVRRAPLLRHRAHDPVLVADLDPSRPAVVAAAVAVAHGALALRQRPAGVAEAGVRELAGRPRPDGP